MHSIGGHNQPRPTGSNIIYYTAIPSLPDLVSGLFVNQQGFGEHQVFLAQEGEQCSGQIWPIGGEMRFFLTIILALVAACEPHPTSVEDIDFEKLEGMQAECANRAASAAMKSFSEDTAWTDLMSVEGAADAVTTITNATQLELQSCIKDIYLMGIEDGRVLERDVY